MPVLSRFALDGGTNQAAARRLLPPEGLIRRAVNVLLRRDNELCQRPGFTALDMGVYGEATATLQAYDLMAYDGRLCALGALSDATAVNGFYEYVGGAEGWRKVLEEMPDATNVREVGGSPDQIGEIFSSTCAAGGGYLLVAYDFFSGTGSVRFTVGHLLRADGDQTLVLEQLLDAAGSTGVSRPIALVTASGAFHLVTLDAGNNDLNVRSITPATDETFGAVTALQSCDTTVIAAAAVLGAPGGYVTVACLAGNLVVRHYNDSHVQQMTRTINTIVPTYLSIHANGPQDDLTIGYIDNADDIAKTFTIALGAGTNISGPNSLTASTSIDGMISVRYETTSSSAYRALVYYTPASPHSSGVSDVGAQLFSVTAAGAVTAGASFVGTRPSTELAVEIDATAGNRYYWGYVWGSSSELPVQALGMLRSGATSQNTSLPLWFQEFGTAKLPPERLGSLCQDASTGLWYATQFVVNNDLETGFKVYEWQHGVKDRRQSAVLAGQLHIAGGAPLVFDGRSLVEIGFGLAPLVQDLDASNSTGSVGVSSDYKIQAHAEYLDAFGNAHRGPPSLVQELTTGAAEDTIDYYAYFGPSLRARSNTGQAGGYRGVSFRTAALADGSTGENLLREESARCSTFTNFKHITLTLSDAALRTLGETTGVIYTQGQTPIPHQAPLPCRYLWPLNERLGQAGLPRKEQWLASKLRFPAEAIHFADPDLFQFQGAGDEGLLGICALGGQPLAFTSRTIQLWQGDGPDHSGAGEFSFAGFVSRQGGLIDADGWRSLCETDEGTFFQRSDDQICMVRGGAVEWVGQAIRDELDTYPVVVAAVHLKKRHAVAFALQNAAGNAGELAFYDLRRKQWFLADILATSLAEYQGRLAYTDTAGAVFWQDAAEGTGAMPTQTIDTHDFDFGTGQSWGEIINAGIVGEYRGDATLTLAVTFDSGLTYTSIGSWAITAANGYSAGKPFSEKKSIPDRKCARFGLRWQITGGSGSAGLRVNEVTLETDTMPGFERRPARDTQ